MNSSPNSAIGRSMKVGKEEILGLVAAVVRFLSGGDEEDKETWKARSTHVVEALKGIDGIKAYVMTDGQTAAPEFAPRAYVDMDAGRAKETIREMREGEPSVSIRNVPGGIVVDPMTMMPGEEEVVARRLKETLSK